MLAQKICASFEIPRVRCEALNVMNDYSMPPTPKCGEKKLFLLAPDPRFPCQDYHEKQPQKTLAYAQAVQYWAERANPPHPGETCCLVRSVQELRWAMKPFTTLSDHAILENAKSDQGAPKAELKGPAQSSTPPAMPTDEPAIPTALLVTTNNQKGTKSSEYPNWSPIHSSHPVATVGYVPLSLGNLR